MQCWRAIQQHGMLADHLIKRVPNFRPFLLNQTLGTLDGGRRTTLFQLVKNKRLEQFKRHLFGQSALV
ncbi:MAG: hypothetical protein JW388_0074 [Nitrospira sp.]|nr:hypothetical protein [Nitrospira sp.]